MGWNSPWSNYLLAGVARTPKHSTAWHSADIYEIIQSPLQSHYKNSQCNEAKNINLGTNKSTQKITTTLIPYDITKLRTNELTNDENTTEHTHKTKTAFVKRLTSNIAHKQSWRAANRLITRYDSLCHTHTLKIDEK